MQLTLDNFESTPVMYLPIHIAPGNFEYFKIFERRYKDMIHVILPGDRKFIVSEVHQDRFGYICKIVDYRQDEENTIIKIVCLDRV